jgi:hypothetical protein
MPLSHNNFAKYSIAHYEYRRTTSRHGPYLIVTRARTPGTLWRDLVMAWGVLGPTALCGPDQDF